jgi:hypothetical protein
MNDASSKTETRSLLLCCCALPLVVCSRVSMLHFDFSQIRHNGRRLLYLVTSGCSPRSPDILRATQQKSTPSPVVSYFCDEPSPDDFLYGLSSVHQAGADSTCNEKDEHYGAFWWWTLDDSFLSSRSKERPCQRISL